MSLLGTRDFSDIIDTEKVIVAGLVKSELGRDTVLQKLKEDHIYDPDIKRIFSTALNLYITGVEFDKNILSAELSKRQKIVLEDCAEKEFSESSLGRLCDKVIEQAKLRDIYMLADEVRYSISDNENDYDKIMGKLHDGVMAISNNHTDAGIMTPADMFDKVMEEIANPNREGIKTHLRCVDNLIGKLPKGAMVVLAARPGFGKSTLGLNICVDNALENIPTLFMSLEMSEEELMMRMLARHCRVNLSKITLGRADKRDMEKLRGAKELFGRMPFHFQSISSLSVPEIKAKARKVNMQTDGKLGLVVVDYIQLMEASGSDGTRNETVAAFSRGLKQLAMEMHIPVIGISQLSRDVEKRESKRPQLSDLRDSGAIEQDANMVFFLYKKGYYTNAEEDENDLDIIIAKNRNGPTGQFKLYNEVQYQNIRDIETTKETNF